MQKKVVIKKLGPINNLNLCWQGEGAHRRPTFASSWMKKRPTTTVWRRTLLCVCARTFRKFIHPGVGESRLGEAVEWLLIVMMRTRKGKWWEGERGNDEKEKGKKDIFEQPGPRFAKLQDCKLQECNNHICERSFTNLFMLEFSQMRPVYTCNFLQLATCDF